MFSLLKHRTSEGANKKYEKNGTKTPIITPVVLNTFTSKTLLFKLKLSIFMIIDSIQEIAIKNHISI